MPADVPHKAPLNHEAFWADLQGFDHLWRRTKEYGERARKVVESQFLLKGYWHPWRLDVEESAGFDDSYSVNIFESVGDHTNLPNGAPVFQTVRDMLLWWEDTPKYCEDHQPNKRIIILKHMQPRVLELLGVLLEIPPEFFLAHCEEFPTLSVVDKHNANDRGSSYWKVPVPRCYLLPDLRAFTLPAHNEYEVKFGNVIRGWVNYVPQGHVTCTGFVSYWAKRYGKDSWTVVLLCDPDYGTMSSVSDRGVSGPLDTLWRRRDLTHVFRQGCPWNVTTSQHCQFIYAMLSNACETRDVAADRNLHTATAFARHIIRSVWEEEVIRIATGVHDIQHEDGEMQRLKKSTDPSGKISRVPGCEEYEEMMEKRRLIREKKTKVRHIMWSFRCRRQTSIPPDAFSLEEHESWAFLEEILDAADTTLGDHMAMFAERSALVQADAAARQARSAGQLTKIATFIVPCSFVASIFSMGGEFAAGERFFYIYWVVSIPVTISLLMWVMINDPDSKHYVQDFKLWLSSYIGDGQKETVNTSGEAGKGKVSETSWLLRRREQKQEHQGVQV